MHVKLKFVDEEQLLECTHMHRPVILCFQVFCEPSHCSPFKARWSQDRIFIPRYGVATSCIADTFVHACLHARSHPKLGPISPVPFPTPPTLKVHSQEHPCVLIDDVGDADSGDDL